MVPKQLDFALSEISANPAKTSKPKKKAVPGRHVAGTWLKGRPAAEQKEKENVPIREVSEWTRAIGYETHDEADFKQVWEGPLRDALSRSLSCPSYHHERAGADGASSRPGVQFSFISSEPGLLRTRIELPSLDKAHQLATQQRLRDLMNGQASSEIAASISKDLKKKSYLLPQYGINVAVRKVIAQETPAQPFSPASD
jgi:hypothetical protein